MSQGFDIAANVEATRERIRRAGGDPDRVTLVGVTKKLPVEIIHEAVAAGVCDLGENYAQELLGKASGAPDGVRWHFLGPVQRNKVPALAPMVHLWHGVDRSAAASAIAARTPGAGILIQVNASGQDGRHGCSVADTPALVATARDLGLDVRGLMAVGPLGAAEAARPGFRRLADLARSLELDELSMGMSGDLEVAIQEGATIVRIGTALFGPRPVDA